MLTAKNCLGVIALLATLSSVAACSAETDAEEYDDEVGTSEAEYSLVGRWTLPADVSAAGAAASVTYDGGPAWNSALCYGGLRPGARRLSGQLNGMFPVISGVDGYSCRPNTASPSKMSIHGTGRALDIFIPTSGGAADNTGGDAVANYLVKNATRLQIQYIVWDRTQWSPNGTGARPYGGPDPHIDHLHVEITEEAAAGGSVGAGGGSSSSGGGGGCVAGGSYCGGNKLVGNRNTLYLCNADGTGTVRRTCANGCSLNSGRDDSCL